MAITVRQTVVGVSSTAGANVTLTYTGAQAGDVAYVFGGFSTAGAANPGISTAGYTNIYANNTTAAKRFGVWRKVLTASEAGPVCLGSGTAGDGVVYGAIILTGVDQGVFEDVAVKEFVSAAAVPNAAAIIPNRDADCILIGACNAVSDTSKGTVTTPGTYTLSDGNANATRPFGVGYGSRILTTGKGASEDPGAWSSWTSASCVAVTIAVVASGASQPAAIVDSAPTFGTPQLRQNIAATFYVDQTGGADANTGLSTGAAWKTLSKVINSVFVPGDQILFKRGEIWREVLLTLWSGTAANPITYGTYGAGAAPIVCGSDIIALTWTDQGGNVWRAPRAASPGVVRVNGTFGTKQASQAACTSAHDWYWDGSAFVYLYETSTPGGMTVEMAAATPRNIGIAFAGNYIIIDGITVEMTTGATLGNIILDNGVANCIVRNCDIRYAEASGVLIYSGAGAYNVVEDCLLHHCGWGVHGYQHTASGAGTETIIRRNECYNNYTSAILCRANYWIIEKNLCYNNGTAAFPNIAIHVYSGTVGEGTGDHNIIRYNLCHHNTGSDFDGGGIGLDQWCDNNDIYGNVCYANRSYGISCYDDANCNIYNNTCYGNVTDVTIQVGEISIVSSTSDLTTNLNVKNNICYATGSQSVAIYIDGNTANNAGISITSNIFYRASGNWYDVGGTRGTSLATWNANSFVGTDVNADPLLSNPASNDLTIQSSSPAKDTGTDLGTSFKYILDRNSVWPSGVLLLDQTLYTAWDIGAYVYTVPAILVNSLAVASPTLGAGVLSKTLTASTLTVAVAYLESIPAFSLSAPADVLVAINLAVNAPAVATATLTQNHVLLATPLATTFSAPGTGTFAQVHALLKVDLAVAPPIVFSVPTFNKIVACVANNAAAGVPSFTNPAVGQNHVLGPVALAVAPPLGIATATFNQSCTLATGNFTVTPPLTIAAGTLAQTHVLVKVDFAVATLTISTSALSITVALTSNNVSAGVPGFVNPAVGQNHVLVPVAVAAGQPTFGQPALNQNCVFTAIAAAAGQPVLGNPTAAILGSDLVALALSVGPPALGQPNVTKALTPTSVAVGIPTFGTPAVTKVLAATSLATGIPSVGTATMVTVVATTAIPITTGIPVLGQSAMVTVVGCTAVSFAVALPLSFGAPAVTKVLTANSLVPVPPTFGAPTLGKVLAASDLADSAPSFTLPAFGQKHVLVPVAVSAGQPLFSSAVLGQAGVMAAMPIEGVAPTIAAATLNQNHVLVALALATTPPTLGATPLGKVLAATSLAVGNLTIPAPVLAKTLAAVNATAGTPVFGSGTLVACAVLVPVGSASGVPTFGQPAIGQGHAFGPTAFVIGAPALPVLTLAINGVMAALPAVAGAPVLGAPAIGQRHGLGAAGASAGPPTLAAPVMTVTVVMTATAATAGLPICSVSVLGQKHVLAAIGTVAGQPVIPILTISISGIMTAVPVIAGQPVFGSAAFKQANKLLPNAASAGAPVLPVLPMGVTVALTAVPLATAPPVLGGPAVSQRHGLMAASMAAGLPVLGTPVLASTAAAAAIPAVAGHPVFGQLTIVQRHGLLPGSLTVSSPSIRVAFFGQAGVMAAIPLWISGPVLSGPAIKQRHTLVGIGAVSGSPALGIPNMVCRVALGATGKAVGALFIAPGTLHQTHQFNAPATAVSPAVFGSPAFKQRQTLQGVSLAVQGPTLGTPGAGVIIHALAAPWPVLSPNLGQSSIGQVHRFTAPDFKTRLLYFFKPRLQTSFELPQPEGLTVGGPRLGTPSMRPPQGRPPSHATIIGRAVSPTPLRGQVGGSATIIGRMSPARIKQLEDA